jgi:hypothetical protein
MICLRNLLRIYEKSNPKRLKNETFFWLPELPEEQKNSIFGS